MEECLIECQDCYFRWDGDLDDVCPDCGSENVEKVLA